MRKEDRQRTCQSMSEMRVYFSPSLLMCVSFCVCVSVCVSGTAWVERLSFLRTVLIENRDFERRRRNNRNSQGDKRKQISTCLCSRAAPCEEMNPWENCVCPHLYIHLCLYSWLHKLWYTVVERLWSLWGSSTQEKKRKSVKNVLLKFPKVIKISINKIRSYRTHTCYFPCCIHEYFSTTGELCNHLIPFSSSRQWLLYPAGPQPADWLSDSDGSLHQRHKWLSTSGTPEYVHTQSLTQLKVI